MEQLSTQAQETLEQWLQDPVIDEATKQELRELGGQAKELEDRFYKELEFGTGGLRGVIGAGSNRMNRYVIGRATQVGTLYSGATRRSGRQAVGGHCS